MIHLSPARLALASLRYYWRSHTAVVAGQAAAVAVLGGALLVGHSVRTSLSEMAVARSGRAAVVVAAEQPFSQALADRVRDARALADSGARTAALFSLPATVLHEASGRRANGVQVYGVDDRFFELHGVVPVALGRSDIFVSTDLGAELGASDGDAIVLRVVRPTDIPADSMHGRRDETGRSIRLTARGVLSRDRMGDFSLTPQQGPVRAVFVSLARLQRDIAQAGRANLMLIAAPPSSDLAARANAALGASLLPDDLGLHADATAVDGTTIIETASGLMSDAIADAMTAQATRDGFRSTGVMTWLANRMTVNGRTVPYSLVTAIDAPTVEGISLDRVGTPPPIVLSEWAATDLQANAGDLLDLEYYQWTAEGALDTRHAPFRVTGTVPMRGLGIDRRLAPDYPGISNAAGLADWDPPFPLDLNLVRPIDEAFWHRYKTAPKAFIPLAAGQELWRSRHGQLSSIRLSAPSGSVTGVDRVMVDGTRSIDRARLGITTVDIRAQNTAAAAGATDFGAYFSYFSFFLMVSALMLSALFFRLSVEHRLTQIGLLRALGFSERLIRRTWLIEASVVLVAGLVAGLVLAVGWSGLMMLGLRTWWVGAVGTTRLRLDVDVASLAIGAVAATLAGLIATAWTVRTLARRSPRSLISGVSTAEPSSMARPTYRSTWLAAITLASAALLSVLGAMTVIPAAGAFFGAGALVLIGGLSVLARSLATPRTGRSLAWLALRNASWRPGRSLTCAGLVASAVFLLVAVDAFRKTPSANHNRGSGTGGFDVIAESAIPIVHDPGTTAGRDALGLRQTTSDTALDHVEITPFRLRPGDDTSCLSLYVPTRPRVLGVGTRFVDAGRFAFGATLAQSAADRANPWRLLGPADATGIVPAIADQTSLEYVLHASVGDVITIDADTTRPVKLRVVAALSDSVLQGEIMIGEAAFVSLYPAITGYRVLLADATTTPGRSAADLATAIEERLSAFGVDAVDVAAKLAAFHRVENTYLSTFQALGALGLVLGCIGLAAVIARNVLERRRELALLGASGFTGPQLRRLIAIEHLGLVGAGLAIGLVAALVAVAPLGVTGGGMLAGRIALWIGGVVVVTVLVAEVATRQLQHLPLVPSLRRD